MAVADKCMTDDARKALLAALERIPTCPEPKQTSRPITRTRWGKAIYEGREYNSPNALALDLGIKNTGFDSARDVFEQAQKPDGTPAEFVYNFRPAKRRGETVVYIEGKRKNPKLK